MTIRDAEENKMKFVALRILPVAALLLALASPAAANIIFHVGNASVAETQESFFDVTCEVTGGQYDLKSYMIELNLTGTPGGVRFTRFDEPSAALFPGQIAEQVSGRPVLPGISASAMDTGLNDAIMANGSGLLRVYFQADPGSAGTYDVSVNPSLQRTNFSNAQAQLLSSLTTVEFTPGELQVLPVPEPAAAPLLLAAVGLCLAISGGLRRVRRFCFGANRG
jgi:hypothetical protein